MNTSQMPLEWLAELCHSHLITEKWLLVENLRLGQQWKDCLALNGQATINLHAKTVNTMAIGLAACVLAKRNFRYVGSATTCMFVRQILVEMNERQELHYFASVSNIDSLAILVTRTISDLRVANLEPQSIERSLNAQGFESEAKGRDLERLFHEYNSRLAARGLVDYAGCLHIAIAGVVDGSISLPPDLLILFPEEIQLSALETQLLTSLTSKAILVAMADSAFSAESCRNRVREAAKSKRVTFGFFSGLGEANEVRRVFQRILTFEQTAGRFDDSELLYTDYERYVPVILEQLSLWLNGIATGEDRVIEVDELPVTFAEGIACVYSRPGRALRSWVRWLRSGYMQSKAVQILREGLLIRPDAERPIGYARLASALRGVPIAFQLDRYLPQIDAAINNSQTRRDEYYRQVASGELEADDRGADWDAGLATLQTVRSMISGMIELVPTASDGAQQVLQKARRFLLSCSRAESKFDRFARNKLLDEINGTLESIDLMGVGDLDVTQWLEDLPVESRVLGSGPRPGCIHVADLGSGGYSGRKQLFGVGFDESHYPRRASVDPILLDTERQTICGSLQTSSVRSERNQQALLRVLERVLGRNTVEVGLSYSARNLAEDRQQYASPALLDLYRLTHDVDAQLSDLISAIGTETSFVLDRDSAQLSITEVELAALLCQPDGKIRRERIESAHPQFERSRVANEALADPAFSAYDGLAPAAGVKLDPTSCTQRMSANSLEAFGTCPRRYFFKYGLGVFPPNQVDVDPDRWLDALQFGSLVHNVFEEFLRGHTEQGLVPDRRRDSQPLLAILHSKIDEKLRDIPAPNQDAHLRQREELREICDIFLQKEEAYCRANNARPWILEASVGLNDKPRSELDCQEPVELTLNDGKVLRMGGRIDRVDRLQASGSEHYAIWDYKSGSAWGFDQAKPFQGGRKLQPFLYLGMLRHRIDATGGRKDSVTSFGYFFPSPKTEGLRIQWTHGELKTGDAVLRNICELMQRGAFIATNESQDCNYCHYKSVCGDLKQVTQQAYAKAIHLGNRQILLPWVELRDLA